MATLSTCPEMYRTASSPTSFVVEQTLQTMRGGKTLTFDSKTGHILVIAAEYGPPAPPKEGAKGGGRGAMLPDSFTILVIGRREP